MSDATTDAITDAGTDEQSEPVILTEVVDRIGIITLNRPHRRNALNGYLIKALEEAVQEMAANDEARVVVLTGAPGEGMLGGFCSGGDTKEGGNIPGETMSRGVPHDALDGDLGRHDLHAAMLLHQMPKPTIAMVGGPAVGAGCSLAGACDLRVASADAVFAASFAPNGLSGDYGGTFFWTRIMGTARARELYFLNEKISAAQALEWGMVNRVVAAVDLRATTMELARTMLRTPSEVWALTKDNLNQAEDLTSRRRELFAIEATNQGKSALAMRDLRRRMKEAAAAKDAGANETTERPAS
jgi:2-(1,2-epoxy-1,2-dihydrophenyl)acetyl-CoA isomerase